MPTRPLPKGEWDFQSAPVKSLKQRWGEALDPVWTKWREDRKKESVVDMLAGQGPEEPYLAGADELLRYAANEYEPMDAYSVGTMTDRDIQQEAQLAQEIWNIGEKSGAHARRKHLEMMRASGELGQIPESRMIPGQDWAHPDISPITFKDHDLIAYSDGNLSQGMIDYLGRMDEVPLDEWADVFGADAIQQYYQYVQVRDQAKENILTYGAED